MAMVASVKGKLAAPGFRDTNKIMRYILEHPKPNKIVGKVLIRTQTENIVALENSRAHRGRWYKRTLNF